uniref:Uncharacterized protein n=1 Tax=Sphaerodactylus townsendi TaxID=933632 RepID=A0ACB8FJC8_9SAUR
MAELKKNITLFKKCATSSMKMAKTDLHRDPSALLSLARAISEPLTKKGKKKKQVGKHQKKTRTSGFKGTLLPLTVLASVTIGTEGKEPDE